MGSFKPLLPMGEKSMLERTIELFTQAGIYDIRVVIGYRAEEIAPVVKAMGAGAIVNSHYESGMLSSIKAGIKNLPNTQQAFFLLPVDVPLVRCQTVSDLLNAWKNNKKGILYPTFINRRGHPPLISTLLIQDILAWNSVGGLRSFLKQHENDTVNVPVADEHILFDMDTPGNYQNALNMLENYDIPTTCECMEILTRRFAVDKPILDHCRAVAQVAGHLTRILNNSGCRIELKLVKASSLLHDMLRTEPDHAQAAAQLLNQMGYARVADIVASHMDISVQDDAPFHAREVVYLADKLVQEDRLVSLHQRFNGRVAQYADAQANAAVNTRFETSLKIKKRFEKQTGLSLDTVLTELAPKFAESIAYDFSY